MGHYPMAGSTLVLDVLYKRILAGAIGLNTNQSKIEKKVLGFWGVTARVH